MNIWGKIRAVSDKQQILCKTSKNLSRFGILSKDLCLSFFSKILAHPDIRVLKFGVECRNFLRAFTSAMARTLAPLRRIVSRDLEVLARHKRLSIPQSFLVHDSLECGHVFTCLTWDVFDLLYAYTENPEVKARWHRCHPCAELLATKKPAQSVKAIAIPAKGVA